MDSAHLTHQVNHSLLTGRDQAHRLGEELGVTSCVSEEIEIPILWAEAKRQEKRTPSPSLETARGAIVSGSPY